MTKQGRNQGGKFASKSDEPRSVRTMRLTDTAWAKLGEVAESRSITRADLLEDWAKQGAPQISQLTIFDEPPILEASTKGLSLWEVETAIAQIVADPQATRDGKDRGSIKRAMQALVNLLS